MTGKAGTGVRQVKGGDGEEGNWRGWEGLRGPGGGKGKQAREATLEDVQRRVWCEAGAVTERHLGGTSA